MESREEAIRLYNKYKKKYNLPDLDEIEKELLIYLKEPTNILQMLLFYFNAKVGQAISIIQQLILPPPTLIGRMEREKTKKLSEEEKEKYFALLKKLTLINRKLSKALFVEEKEAFKIFLDCYEEYKKLKKEIIEVISKCEKIWEEIVKEKEEKKKQVKFYG